MIMIHEDKELLLRDLCARLPYRIKCLVNYTFCNETTDYEDVKSSTVDTLITINQQTESYFFEWLSEWFDIDEFKPYLFPLSSMTPKQKAELAMLVVGVEDIFKAFLIEVEFYHKHHIDYRGLIPMGLAIDATNLGIYK